VRSPLQHTAAGAFTSKTLPHGGRYHLPNMTSHNTTADEVKEDSGFRW
jgi:hypothetical protein